jgi:putative phage-type endonuclease
MIDTHAAPSTCVTLEDALKRVGEVRSYRCELQKLRDIPYIAQRTDEWYNLRKQRLTASDIAQAIGKGKFGNRDQLIQKKVAEVSANPPQFKQAPPMKWGTMFEDMAMRCYKQRNDNIAVYEFGLIPHPSLNCFGASPDGITELGIMTEIKCPYKRKITGEVPDYYELQMQGQMAVCGLKECDYIECEMQVFDNTEDYLLMNDGKVVDHGVICEFERYGEVFYEYSQENLTPKEAEAWAREFSSREMRRDKDLNLVRFHMWRLKHISVQRIYFDEARWNSVVPRIEAFWSDVVEARAKAETVPQLAQTTKTLNLTQKTKYKFVKEDEDDVIIY